MSARYAPLSNPRSAPDAEQEMENAFEFDNDDDDDDDASESTPFTTTNVNDSHHGSPLEHVDNSSPASYIPGAYDFEREYDYPPPGSPPRPSARALPNDIGNTNGFLPTSPVHVPQPRPSFFRRAVGVLLPTHYTQVPTDAPSTSHVLGGGIENDGVFANVMAKPQASRVVQSEDGEVHVVPENSQKEAPPSYTEAQADAVPPYWETTVHAPGIEPGADMIIDDLPTGSVVIFFLNVFISWFFQFVGFLLTHIVATSHAAKYGSRAGLGLTMIQFGLYSRTVGVADEEGGTGGVDDTQSDNWLAAPAQTDGSNTGQTDDGAFLVSSRDWIAFFFMTIGWFILLSSVLSYWRVKRWERSLRRPEPAAPADIERDIAIRRNLQNVFGISYNEGGEEQHRNIVHSDENGGIVVIPGRRALEEARLARDLRAAGLL